MTPDKLNSSLGGTKKRKMVEGVGETAKNSLCFRQQQLCFACISVCSSVALTKFLIIKQLDFDKIFRQLSLNVLKMSVKR